MLEVVSFSYFKQCLGGEGIFQNINMICKIKSDCHAFYNFSILLQYQRSLITNLHPCTFHTSFGIDLKGTIYSFVP